MTPTLSKSCSDTQTPNTRFSAAWAYGAFGQIVLQCNHHIVHMLRFFFQFPVMPFGISQPAFYSRLEDKNSRGGASRMWFNVACIEVNSGLWVYVGGGALCSAACRLDEQGVCALLLVVSGACWARRDIQLTAAACFYLSGWCSVCQSGGVGCTFSRFFV